MSGLVGADGLQGEVLDLGEQVADGAGVVEQGLPGLELFGGEAAGDGLAADLAGPLGVGAVQFGRAGVPAVSSQLDSPRLRAQRSVHCTTPIRIVNLRWW